MCSCEPGWVCAKCRDTRLDDRYSEDEREPLDEPILRSLPPGEAVSGA